MKISQNHIILQHLSFSYGKETLFSNLSLLIKKGDFVAVVGPNGSGKSTLMKLLLGEIMPSKGSISVLGKLAYMPQYSKIEAQFPATLEELFSLELNSKNKTLFKTLVKKLHLSHKLHSQFSSLSGGQKQKTLIILALLRQPEILILDEPTIGVDQKSQEEFHQLLKELNLELSMTILLVSHDIQMISTVANKLLCLGGDHVCFEDISQIDVVLSQAYGKHHHRVLHTHQ